MEEELDRRTRGLILYLVGKMAVPTKTSIIKMCYLCDLAAVQSGMNQITAFKYIRYYYGPFDKNIEDYLLDLVKKREIVSRSEYSSGGGEYERFSLPSAEIDPEDYIEDLTDEEKTIVDSILDSLGSLNAKMLTEIAYKTNPMKKFGATLGGTEHLTEALDLGA